MNIVKMILDMFGEGALGKLSGMLGLSETQARSGVTAAVPAILAALMAKSTKPDGAAAVEREIDSVNSRSPGDVGDTWASGGVSEPQAGTSPVSGLFGGGMLSSLAGGLGKHLGMDESKTNSLLAMVTPTVLGALGKAKNATGMGVSDLLASQKDNILSAMPSGLGSILKGVPGLGGMTAVAPAMAGMTRAATGGRGRMLVPLLVLIAVGLGALWFFNKGRTTDTENPLLMSPRHPSVNLPDTSKLTSDFGSTLTGVTRSLEGVTDSASAQAALPRLKESLASVDSLQAQVERLPESARSPIINAIRSARPGLKTQADRVLAIPGVGGLLKPTIDSLMAKVDAIAGQ